MSQNAAREAFLKEQRAIRLAAIERAADEYIRASDAYRAAIFEALAESDRAIAEYDAQHTDPSGE